ncbi:hypothetical protein HDV05_001614 [Chytridiales sp. JEL 0842]|nr:hypothetical protein HDV05_001614 [Chytridiales sp. JEL 0842]
MTLTADEFFNVGDIILGHEPVTPAQIKQHQETIRNLMSDYEATKMRQMASMDVEAEKKAAMEQLKELTEGGGGGAGVKKSADWGGWKVYGADEGVLKGIVPKPASGGDL